MRKPILRFTLDTNCLIDVDDGRLAKGDVLAIIEAARRGEADVAMLASSASERQPGGGHLDNFGDFQKRMIDLGLSDIALLRPLGKLGVCYWGFSIYGDEKTVAREQLIFETLFPTIPYKWTDYAAANGLDQEALTSRGAWKWRNALCDAQAFWCHENDERDVFVTSDANFARRLAAASAFSTAKVNTPAEAADMLQAAA